MTTDFDNEVYDKDKWKKRISGLDNLKTNLMKCAENRCKKTVTTSYEWSPAMVIAGRLELEGRTINSFMSGLALVTC